MTCAQIHTDTDGAHSEIEYRPAVWFRPVSADALTLNLDFQEYKRRYASDGPIAHALGRGPRRMVAHPGAGPRPP